MLTHKHIKLEPAKMMVTFKPDKTMLCLDNKQKVAPESQQNTAVNHKFRQDLYNFYQSKNGIAAANNFMSIIDRCWPSLEGKSICGMGFSVPLLSRLDRGHKLELFALESSYFDDLCIQNSNINIIPVKGYSSGIPSKDNSFDHVLAVHCVEYEIYPQILLKEIWRVLKAGGKAIIIIPNYMNIWHYFGKCSKEHNNINLFKLSGYLNMTPFNINNVRSALFFAPNIYSFLPYISNLVENISGRVMLPIGGAWVIEVEKKLVPSYANKKYKLANCSC
jgi:SAM-dependent methyltransferase